MMVLYYIISYVLFSYITYLLCRLFFGARQISGGEFYIAIAWPVSLAVLIVNVLYQLASPISTTIHNFIDDLHDKMWKGNRK